VTLPAPRPFIVHENQCELEGWDDPARGKVQWRTLLSADRTPTTSLTVGVVELGPGKPDVVHLHRHTQPEVYYILSGEGIVTIEGREHPVRPGTAVFIPGDAEHAARNTGSELLRLLYAFAVDSFDEVKYVFPDA
jgi:mannose-6-phosphate isomerase-like protein (cupin superfamily)